MTDETAGPAPGGARDETAPGGARDGTAPRARPLLGGRSPARERALHLLYESEMTGCTPGEVLASAVLVSDEYTEALVGGVDREASGIDALVAELAPSGWSPQRLATIDRTILRMAVFELGHRADVPTGVVLSEAVELAETYGSDDSPRFVNGLLAAAARRLRPDDVPQVQEGDRSDPAT